MLSLCDTSLVPQIISCHCSPLMTPSAFFLSQLLLHYSAILDSCRAAEQLILGSTSPRASCFLSLFSVLAGGGGGVWDSAAKKV